jgi:hypothetical protein
VPNTLLRNDRISLTTRNDQNYDGNADILWRNALTGQNWLYEMNGSVIANSQPINTVSSPWQIIGRGDFDGDGKGDILWRNTTDASVYMYLMDGSTIRSGRGVHCLPRESHWNLVAIADFTGDHKDDTLWRDPTTGDVWLKQMNGFQCASTNQVTTINDNDWQIVSSSDLNADGKADLIFRHASTGLTWKYLMNGHVIASTGKLMVAGNEWKLVSTGDFDGDGDADLLWRNINDGRNFVYLLDRGTVDWNARDLLSQFSDPSWQAAMTADFDGDGNDDILWRNTDNGSNYMYLMNGTEYTGKPMGAVSNLNWSIVK